MLKRCHFFLRINYIVGLTTRATRKKTALKMLDVNTQLQAWRIAAKLKSCLGVQTFFIGLVRNLVRPSSPLDNLLRKLQLIRFVLDRTELEAIENFQQRRILPPILARLYAEGLVKLDEDVRDAQSGVQNSRNNLKDRASGMSVGLAHQTGLKAFTIRRAESDSCLCGRCGHHDCSLKDRVWWFSLATSTTVRAHYIRCFRNTHAM